MILIDPSKPDDDEWFFGVYMTSDESGYYSDDHHMYTAGYFSPNYPLPALLMVNSMDTDDFLQWLCEQEPIFP